MSLGVWIGEIHDLRMLELDHLDRVERALEGNSNWIRVLFMTYGSGLKGVLFDCGSALQWV